MTTADVDVFARATQLQLALRDAGLRADTLVVNRVLAPAVGQPTDQAARQARDDLNVVRGRQSKILDSAGAAGTVFTLPLLVTDDDRLGHLYALANGIRRHTL